MANNEMRQLYFSILKEEKAKALEKHQNVQKTPFANEKTFLNKVLNMPNKQIYEEYDSLISEYFDIQSVLGDLSKGIKPSLVNPQYYEKHKSENFNVFAENLKNDMRFQFYERVSSYETETKENLKNLLLQDKYMLDYVFEPPTIHKDNYINLLKELLSNQGVTINNEQDPENTLLHSDGDEASEPMFGGLIPLSVMVQICFNELQLHDGNVSSEFFSKLGKLLKELANKPKMLKEMFEENPSLENVAGCITGTGMGHGDSPKTLQYIFENAKSNPAIRELAEKLGRSGSENPEIIKKKIKVSENSWSESSAYKGQITGLKLSDNISSVINSELALYKSPATKKLFMQKYSQKQLLSYSYKLRQKKPIKSEKEKNEVPPSSKGPVLVCVDTSGSMSVALQTVKSLALCLAEIVQKEKRRCYFLTFDYNNFRIYDIGYGCKKSQYKKLKDFLMEQAGGGTDPSEAFEYVLSLLAENNWKEADVLTISDFEMGDFSESLEEEIKEQQKKETKFYGLLMNNSKPNKDIMKNFNENYYYEDGSRILKKLDYY